MQRMGISILNHLLPQGLLLELDFQSLFKPFLRVPSVLDMVASILDLHPFKTQSLLDLFFRCQVFHQKTLRIFVITVALHYIMSLLNTDTEFP